MFLNFYFKHRKRLWIMGALILLLLLFLLPETSFAQDTDPDINKLMQGIQQKFTLIMQFVSAWLWPVLLMIGGLLDNELIFGGEMGERLLDIWVQMRNIVNILFVLILLIIAAYNVLGFGEEGIGGVNLSFKQTLPKFVIALIAVNFSFLAAKVVLDFTNVLTVAAFSLPSTLADDSFKDHKREMEDILCRDGGPMQPLFCNRTGDAYKYNQKAEAFFDRLSGDNVALVMALNFGKLAHQRYVKEGLKDITQLSFNILFGVVLYVVYALAFIVLFIVLLVRLVVLWVAVAMSPLIAINIVAPGLLQHFSIGGEGGGPAQTFIKHAIAPLIIGLFMSIGYLMLEAFQGDPGAAGGEFASVSLSSIDPNALPTEISDLQQLIVAVATVVVVWMGVFGAAKDTLAGSITETIKGHAESFGKWTAKLPFYAQVIPIDSGTKKMSLMGAFKTLQQTPGVMDREFGKSAYEMDDHRRGDPRQIEGASADQAAGAIKGNLSALQTPAGLKALEEQLVRNFGVARDLVQGKSLQEMSELIHDRPPNDQVIKLAQGLGYGS
ncbi:MAG: hypothetical protein UY05_C0039G0009, partial [Candidatus Peregrinibacteria bacterium GW2011_GWA2_47_7]